MHQCGCNVLFMQKSISREKSVLPIEKFSFLILARSTIMLQHLVIHFSLHYLSSGRFREVKNKGKFRTFSSKSGRGRLSYERWSLKRGSECSDLTWKLLVLLENWALKRFGRLREVVATGSLLRSRFLGCHAMLQCVTPQKTAAKLVDRLH